MGGLCGLQANGVWGELTALKKVVTEPKGTGEAFDGVMKDYYGAIKKGQGGLFMAVCRGKVTCNPMSCHHRSADPSTLYMTVSNGVCITQAFPTNC